MDKAFIAVVVVVVILVLFGALFPGKAASPAGGAKGPPIPTGGLNPLSGKDQPGAGDPASARDPAR